MESSAAQGPSKIRAFVALKTPPGWDEKLGELQEKLKRKFPGDAFRWVKPEQIHITVRFFGWITEAEAESVVTVLCEVCSRQQQFTLSCEGLGCFPNARRPRVLWAGLTGDLQVAEALQTDISTATKMFGEPPEERPFKPHLTLARLKEPNRRSAAGLEEVIVRGFSIAEPWRVQEVVLMRSTLSPQGARYEPLANWDLAA